MFYLPLFEMFIEKHYEVGR